MTPANRQQARIAVARGHSLGGRRIMTPRAHPLTAHQRRVVRVCIPLATLALLVAVLLAVADGASLVAAVLVLPTLVQGSVWLRASEPNRVTRPPPSMRRPCCSPARLPAWSWRSSWRPPREHGHTPRHRGHGDARHDRRPNRPYTLEWDGSGRTRTSAGGARHGRPHTP